MVFGSYPIPQILFLHKIILHQLRMKLMALIYRLEILSPNVKQTMQIKKKLMRLLLKLENGLRIAQTYRIKLIKQEIVLETTAL